MLKRYGHGDPYERLLRQNKRLNERKETETRRQLTTERSLKRIREENEAYERGEQKPYVYDALQMPTPVSLVVYNMKQSNDTALVHSDIVSRARHTLLTKRIKPFDTQDTLSASSVSSSLGYLEKKCYCSLFGWQENVVKFIENREADTEQIGSKGLMLCLDMGLGKTIISLTHILRENQNAFRQTGNRHNGCTLIAVPNKLVADGWINEVRSKWPTNTFEYHILHSSKNRPLSRVYIENCCDFLLVTYATIKATYRAATRTHNTETKNKKTTKSVKNAKKLKHTKNDEDQEDEEKYDELDEEDHEEENDDEEEDDEEDADDDMTESAEERRSIREYRWRILYETTWKRVIGDESHCFVNTNTLLYNAMKALKSDVKWVVTGTPIQNSLRDICASFYFIDVPVTIGREHELTDSDKACIKETLRIVMVRKMKHEIKHLDTSMVITPIIKTIKVIEFESIVEKIIYYTYASYPSIIRSLSNATHRLRNTTNGNSAANKTNYTNIASILQLLIQLCVGLPLIKDLVLPCGLLTLGNDASLRVSDTPYRECVLPPKSVATTNESTHSVVDYSKTDRTLEWFASQLYTSTVFSHVNNTGKTLSDTRIEVPDGYNLEYAGSVTETTTEYVQQHSNDAIVWDPYTDKEGLFDLHTNEEHRRMYTALYGELCEKGVECVRKLRRDAKKAKDSVRVAMIDNIVSRVLRPIHYSTKNRHIIKYIKDTVIPNDGKVIVFSNYIRSHESLANDLNAHGISSIIVNGTTSDYAACIAQFRASLNTRVLILSYKLGNFGLDITQANYIIFMHPCWNPHVIEQSENRVHRIGQLRTVYIVHFIMNHTIELYVMSLSYGKTSMTKSYISQGGHDSESSTLTQSPSNDSDGHTKTAITPAHYAIERYENGLYEYTVTQ